MDVSWLFSPHETAIHHHCNLGGICTLLFSGWQRSKRNSSEVGGLEEVGRVLPQPTGGNMDNIQAKKESFKILQRKKIPNLDEVKSFCSVV